MVRFIDKIFKPKYRPDSAGYRMIKNIPTALPQENILDVKQRLFDKAQEFETLNYIYVVDKAGKLVGVFSLKEIFRQKEEVSIEELMVRNVVKVRPHTDQERVAILALKYNLKSLPVVDKNNLFLGIIPSDVILTILYSENLEDILHFAGISKNNNFVKQSIQASPIILTRLRLPWLIFGLLGGLFAAQIVNLFETSLKSHFILAAFIPLIVYMADAVGVQAQTLFIRGLALEANLDIKKYFLKELKISFIIALILATLLSLVSFLWFGSFLMGIILGISLFLTVICASIIAIVIPWLLEKFKKDPAIGSGPFATIVRDVLSLVLYFSVALLLLNIF